MEIVKEIICKDIKGIQAKKARSRKGGLFDPLKDHQDYLLCLVSIVGSDGKTDHAITIADGFIFDGNFNFKLKLCRKNLDECCSTDDHKCSYRGVENGWLFKRRIG